MPVNRNALIRYKTIDNCLRNRYRRWTLEDIIDACSEALYEYEGIDKGVSRRTIQMDIQMMRSEKLGYNAPISVLEKKYYTYEDPEYSITNIPLTEQDLGKLTEVVDILKQFKGFSHFQALSGMVQKLEDKIHVSKTKDRPVIDLEKNENLKGLEFIDPIYQAIVNKKALQIGYQSFKARSSNDFVFHPAILKEFKNRWFLLGKKKLKAPFVLLALDRINTLETSDKAIITYDDQVIANYFKDVIGVSVSEGLEKEEVQLHVNHTHAPYVLTKPIHHSQKMIGKNDDGVIISIQVQLNFELEKEILGFGDGVKVLSPQRLRSRIKNRLINAVELYETELNGNLLSNLNNHLNHRGYFVINQVYTKKSIRKIGSLINEYLKSDEVDQVTNSHSMRHLVQIIPALKDYLFIPNIKKILDQVCPNAFLTKAIFFNKSSHANWLVQWHQDIGIVVKERIETPGFEHWTAKGNYYGVNPPIEILNNIVTIRIHLDDTSAENGALKVLPGSHKTKLQPTEIELITKNAVPVICVVDQQGIQIMKPLLLHTSSKSTSNQKRRVLHLEFSNMELPNGLEWAEKMKID